ncbi:MAG: hypothetical protein DI568_15310 [Sphingomonas sp.]|nr:MAG: hypothetical protein DI568_15310 [Sphingomonas sp.]
MLERMNRQKCREGNFPADMKTINNKLTAYADKLQITAIADYSFRLAAITTLNVIEETAAAMVEPADSQPF